MITGPDRGAGEPQASVSTPRRSSVEPCAHVQPVLRPGECRTVTDSSEGPRADRGVRRVGQRPCHLPTAALKARGGPQRSCDLTAARVGGAAGPQRTEPRASAASAGSGASRGGRVRLRRAPRSCSPAARLREAALCPGSRLVLHLRGPSGASPAAAIASLFRG